MRLQDPVAFNLLMHHFVFVFSSSPQWSWNSGSGYYWTACMSLIHFHLHGTGTSLHQFWWKLTVKGEIQKSRTRHSKYQTLNFRSITSLPAPLWCVKHQNVSSLNSESEKLSTRTYIWGDVSHSLRQAICSVSTSFASTISFVFKF